MASGNRFEPEIDDATARHDTAVADALGAFDTGPRVTCARCGQEFREADTRIVPVVALGTSWPELEPWVGVPLCRCDAADLEEAIRRLDLHSRGNPVPTEDPYAPLEEPPLGL